MTTKKCRHCKHPNVNRPRGLCWSCYYTPGVKELYPSTSIYARRGTGNGHRIGAPLDDQPTTHAPGTPEKVSVLEDRANRGVAVFHPADARYRGDPRPLEFIEEARLLAEIAVASDVPVKARTGRPRIVEARGRVRLDGRGPGRASASDDSFNDNCIEVPSGGGYS